VFLDKIDELKDQAFDLKR